MTDREIMQQALEALTAYDGTNGEGKRKRVLATLRDRLAQPEQELVIDCPRCGHCCPQSKPMTDEEIEVLAKKHNGIYYDCDITFARAIEAKLKEKNT